MCVCMHVYLGLQSWTTECPNEVDFLLLSEEQSFRITCWLEKFLAQTFLICGVDLSQTAPTKWVRMPGDKTTHSMLIQVNLFMANFPLLWVSVGVDVHLLKMMKILRKSQSNLEPKVTNKTGEILCGRSK